MWRTQKSRPALSLSAKAVERGLVDRARAEAAAEDQQAALVGRDPEPLPGRAAVGGEHRRRHRAAGDEVGVALEAGDREREADPPGAAGEHPVGEAEVAVGLGQDQRQPQAKRGEARGPGDVSAAAQHGIGAALAQDLRRRRAPRPRP